MTDEAPKRTGDVTKVEPGETTSEPDATGRVEREERETVTETVEVEGEGASDLPELPDQPADDGQEGA